MELSSSAGEFKSDCCGLRHIKLISPIHYKCPWDLVD